MSALASVAAVTMTTHCAGRRVLKQRKFILSQTRRPGGPQPAVGRIVPPGGLRGRIPASSSFCGRDSEAVLPEATLRATRSAMELQAKDPRGGFGPRGRTRADGAP